MDDDNFSKITRFLNQKFGKYASISMTNRDLRADPIARTRIDQWYLVSEGRKIFSIHAIRNKIETINYYLYNGRICNVPKQQFWWIK